MSYPKTASEWWESLITNHSDIVSLVRQFHPNSLDRREWRGTITAPGAERVCEQIRRIETGSDADVVEEFEAAIRERDGSKCASILGMTWFGMPESVEVRDFPAFGALCDLCSESYLVVGDNDDR